MRYAILFLWLYSGLLVVHAQEHALSGILVDKSGGTAIPAASLTIKSAEGKILSFKTTDKNGNFSLKIPLTCAGCTLEINHLGYKKYKADLSTLKNGLRIELEQQTVLLDDVQIKSRPKIQRMGDTLSYDVGAFAKDEDRSIGDVIKRLPGMEVGETGQIKFQGKTISNLYIDGDDLLNDRYAIGTRTIPHRLVKDIQVLNNHEHIKVLKNKRFTDQVAINLVIKDEARLTMTGEVKLGAGLPKQYDSELNNILFNKKLKMLNVLSGNNIGQDLSNDLIGFDRENTLARLGTMPINNLLDLGTVGPPPLNKTYYLMNNSVSLNTNNLINTKKDWQLKSNIQALYNKQTQDFNGQSSFSTAEQTISFDEQQYSRVNEFLAAVRLSANKNTTKQYITNNLALEYEKEDGKAQITGNQQDITVHRHHRIRGISNQLEYVPELKNGHIIQADWSFNYGEKPQKLQLSPGIFPELMNDNNAYPLSLQEVNVPNLFSNISVGYRLPKGKINQYYSLSASLEDQKLKSHIRIGEPENLYAPTLDSAQNNLHWSRINYALTASYSWKKNRLETALELPVIYQQTSYNDPFYQLDDRLGKWLFAPQFRTKLKTFEEDDLDFLYSYRNTTGNIQDVYRGIIITNYRSLSTNTAQINESNTHSFAFNYRLNRTLKLLYSNMGLQYTLTSRAAMLAQHVTNNISQTTLLPLPNKVKTWSVTAGIDKYIFALASTFKLGSAWSISDFQQVFNDELLPFRSQSFSLFPDLEAKIWRQLNASYQGSLTWSSSSQKEGQRATTKIFSLTQSLGLPISLFNSSFVRVNGRHLYTRQPGLKDINYFFLDAFARYRIKSWKTDLELNLSNLMNVKTFETYTITANQQTQNSYELRGRMLVLKAIFAI